MNISKANYLKPGCQTVKQTEMNHQITLAKKIMDAEVDLKLKEPTALAMEALHKEMMEAELNFKLEQMKLEIEKNKPLKHYQKTS